MEQVAAQAGVEKANIYYYYKGKEQLYRALMDGIIDRFLQEVTEFLKQPQNPGDSFALLDGFLDTFFGLVERYQSLVTLAIGELIHPPRKKSGRSSVTEMLEQVEALGASLVAEGIRKGHFREQDPAQAVVTLEGALFHYFFLPDERVQALTGAAKFDPDNLKRRRAALRQQIRSVLAR